MSSQKRIKLAGLKCKARRQTCNYVSPSPGLLRGDIQTRRGLHSFYAAFLSPRHQSHVPRQFWHSLRLRWSNLITLQRRRLQEQKWARRSSRSTPEVKQRASPSKLHEHRTKTIASDDVAARAHSRTQIRAGVGPQSHGRRAKRGRQCNPRIGSPREVRGKVPRSPAAAERAAAARSLSPAVSSVVRFRFVFSYVFCYRACFAFVPATF